MTHAILNLSRCLSTLRYRTLSSIRCLLRPTRPVAPTPVRPTPPTPNALRLTFLRILGNLGNQALCLGVAGKFNGIAALAKKYDRKGKLKHAEEAT